MKSQTKAKVYLKNLKFFMEMKEDKSSLKYTHQKKENQNLLLFIISNINKKIVLIRYYLLSKLKKIELGK